MNDTDTNVNETPFVQSEGAIFLELTFHPDGYRIGGKWACWSWADWFGKTFPDGVWFNPCRHADMKEFMRLIAEQALYPSIAFAWMTRMWQEKFGTFNHADWSDIDFCGIWFNTTGGIHWSVMDTINFTGAMYDCNTEFPDEFDPTKAGMIFIGE